MHINAVRRVVRRAGEVQRRRPEQAVKVDNVFADKVNLLGGRVSQQRIHVDALLVAVGLQAGQVADRRVEPDVEILARRIGDRDAEVGRIAGDIPVGQLAFTVIAIATMAAQPLVGLVGNLRLQTVGGGPLAQKIHTALIGQTEEEMFRFLHHRRRARQGRFRILQVGRRIHRAAAFAVVAVLIGRATARAFALDVAVGQEHRFDRVEKLLDGALFNEAGGLELAVDVLREKSVFVGVGRMPVIEFDVEAVKVLRTVGGDLRHQLLRGNAFGFGLKHDRCAVGIIRTDKMHRVPAHPLETYPNIRLRVFHDVPDMERSIGVGQGGGDEQSTRHGSRGIRFWTEILANGYFGPIWPLLT